MRRGDAKSKWLRRLIDQFDPESVQGNHLDIPVGRDQRLDMFRGLALVMIFINHVPGNVFEAYTSRNFGFSDAAEAFVLMSGIAAGLAYSTGFVRRPIWPAVLRVWGRARHLYVVHLAITLISLAIFAAGALWFGAYELLEKINIAPIFAHPLEAMIGIPALTHQLGYLNILPLYAVLLVLAPLPLLFGQRWPIPTLLVSVALWVVAGQFRLNLPNYPNSGGWFFNPLSWQLIFVVGLLAGMNMKRGALFVPRSRVLVAIAALFVVLVLLWVKVTEIGDIGRSALGALSELGAPFYITWFDKTFLAFPRLLHALALAYLLASLPAMRWLAETVSTAPLRLLGRHGLPVFAVGTLLSILLQALRVRLTVPNFAVDCLTIGGGLFLLLLLAWILDLTDKRRAQMLRGASDLPGEFSMKAMTTAASSTNILFGTSNTNIVSVSPKAR